MEEEAAINLALGWPSPSLLPADLISSACRRMLASPSQSASILQYAPDEGYLPLRSQLSLWLATQYRVSPSASRICITGGASQGLACILQSFTDPLFTQAVWMVAPAYFLAAGIFKDAGFGGRLKAVPEDEEGIDLDVLERRMSELEAKAGPDTPPLEHPDELRKLYRHVVYAVPTCANPSGRTMSVRRREGLVRLARRHDALIVCDDVYDFLQWPLQGPLETTPPLLPRLCDIDAAMGQAPNDPHGFGHAVSNGSFSKIAGPGVRTGWVEGTEAFAFGLSRTGSSRSGGAPSQFCAAMMAELLRAGELQDWVETAVRPGLRRRHAVMMEGVRRYLLPLGVTARETSSPGGDTYGGYFVWLGLGGLGLEAGRVKDEALRDGVVVGRGGDFAVPGDEEGLGFGGNVRLSFSWESEERIAEGVRRLGEVIRRMRA